MPDPSLESIVDDWLRKPVPEPVRAMADAVRRERANGVLAVLAYGSSLRGTNPAETLIDLYVLTRTPRDASGSLLGRWGCRLVPPNVHYLETTAGRQVLRSKYAVLCLDAFERRCGAETRNPYFWARFSQPCRLVHAADDEVRRRVAKACADAVRTMLAEASRERAAGEDPLALWAAGFAQTYRTELRPEGPERARAIVEANRDYYQAVTQAALREGLPELHRPPWALRRLSGKALSVARLLKAAFTFQGGADYLAWKISRHSGVPVALKPWQRRHPVLGAIALLPGLIRKGAVR